MNRDCTNTTARLFAAFAVTAVLLSLTGGTGRVALGETLPRSVLSDAAFWACLLWRRNVARMPVGGILRNDGLATAANGRR